MISFLLGFLVCGNFNYTMFQGGVIVFMLKNSETRTKSKFFMAGAI